MKPFFLMLGFFTRLPVPKIEFTETRMRKAMKLMPLGGLVIGAVLVLILLLLVLAGAPNMIRGAILTCAYIFLSGGLHFDGLADTCDGVFSGRSREQSLEIMKDSRIGVFGTLGLFMAGLVYFAAFTEAPAAGLLVFPVCGRACCLISASLAPYARAEGMGKATGLEGGAVSVLSAAVSIVGGSLLTLPLTLLLSRASAMAGPASANGLLPVMVCSFIAGGAAALVTTGMTAGFKRKLGGVTGDTFGAVIEVSSLVYLLVFVIL